MGMFTIMDLDVKLKEDACPKVRSLLECLIYGDIDDVTFLKRPKHPFFQDTRASFLGSCRIDYDAEDHRATICPSFEFPYLKIRCEVKNYTEVLEKFLDFINDEVEEISGTYQYEEDFNQSTIHMGVKDGRQRIFVKKASPESYGFMGYSVESDDVVEFIPTF